MNTPTKDKDFFRVPHQLVNLGLVARLKPSELKVYLVLSRYANYKTDICYPGVKKIQELAGVNKNAIAPAVRALERIGLIKRSRANQRFAFRTIYRVIRGPVLDLCIVPDKTEQCRRFLKGNDGRFGPLPEGQALNVPSNEDPSGPPKLDDHIVPSEMEQKEKKRENINRDTKAAKKKTLSVLNKDELDRIKMGLGGPAPLKAYLRKQGYPQEEIERLEI